MAKKRDVRVALTDLVGGGVRYLAGAQKTDGSFAGAVWSDLAYHVPHFDYHAGGSHHFRTPGSSGLAFLKVADRLPELDLRRKAEHAYDWICTCQHDDGGLFEITNNDRPSQFHLDYERSAISLGMVTQGMFKAIGLGLEKKPQYVDFLIKAAEWQMTVEVAPGNFLHSEGYPEQYVILNANAHAAETLQIAATLTDDADQAVAWRSGAERAIGAILSAQRSSGMFPYRTPDEGQHTISYTATCVWVLQNLIDAGMLPRETVERQIRHACSFLADSVDEQGRLLWEGREVHGQKYHTWVYGMVMRCLTWWRHPDWDEDAERALSFVHGELFNPTVGLARLYDFPLGEDRVVCGHPCVAAEEYACAFNQADLLDCLIDVESLLCG